MRILFQFLWELPQNFLGIILRLLNRNKILKTEYIHGRYFYKVENFGISLGSFIFWFSIIGDDETVKKHEYGHSVQSRMLGPLYLLIIGIPSISRAAYRLLYYKIKKVRWNNYHNGFPENWADSLGDKYF